MLRVVERFLKRRLFLNGRPLLLISLAVCRLYDGSNALSRPKNGGTNVDDDGEVQIKIVVLRSAA